MGNYSALISHGFRRVVAIALTVALVLSSLPVAGVATAAPSDGSLDFATLATGPRTSITTANLANLADGNPATHSGDYRPDVGKSFMLDFGENFGVRVTEVQMQPRTGFNNRLWDARVEGSQDGFTWTEITTARIRPTSGDMVSLSVHAQYQTVPYRFLKVLGEGNQNIFSVGELRISGSHLEVPNLIDNVSIRSNNEDTEVASDGDTVTLSFRSASQIRDVSVVMNGKPASVTSADNSEWSASYTVSPYEFPGQVKFAIVYKDEAGEFGKPVNSTTDGSEVSIEEPRNFLDILNQAYRFGIPVKDADSNITIDYNSTGWPSGNEFVNNIMDRNTSTFSSWNGPDNNGAGTYLIMDMGEGNAVSLDRVYVLPRADQVGRLNGTYLQGSNDGTIWNTVSSRASGSGGWETLSISDKTSYRYLKLTNDNRWYLNLAEIKLYGKQRQAGVLYPDDLVQQISIAEGIVAGGQAQYSDDTWQALETALSNGQAVIAEIDNGSGDVTQGTLDMLTASLIAAIRGLLQEVKVISVVSEEGFVHPGVSVTKEVLENIRTQIRNEQEPWFSYYNAMLESDFANTNFTMSNSTDGVTVRQDSYNASNVKDMAARDGQRAYTQALLYFITGNETYRSNALRILRIWQQMDPDKYQYFADSHIHTGIPLYYMVMAAELLRYTTSSDELKWTEEDTEKFTQNVIDPAVSTFLDYNDRFMNQHNYPLYGSIASYIFKNDKANFDKAVEWFTVNESAPDKYMTGSIYWLLREMTHNDETGLPVDPYVQLVEMGRDLAHSDGDVSNMASLARLVQAQSTKVDPVKGTVTTEDYGVSVYEFLDDRILTGADYFFKNQLGYDINWTPVKTSAASEWHQEKLYSIVSDEYKGRILYSNLTGWDLYYEYRYKLGYTEEQLEAKAPYFVKAFKDRMAPNFYFAGAGSDADVSRRYTGDGWWIYIPEEVADEPQDSISRTVRKNIANDNRYILQLEERYSILDGSNGVVEETEYIRTQSEGDVNYIRTIASDNQTLLAAYNIFFINRDNSAKVALKIRTNGMAKLELKREKELEPFHTIQLPDTGNEWRYVTFDMGQDTVSYGQFSTRTFQAYFNIVGEGTQVDIDYMNIKADNTLSPPSFNNIEDKSMNLTLIAGSTIQYDFSATDSNSSDTVFYQLQGDPLPGAVLDSSTGEFTWTPTANQAGNYESIVVASDGQSVSTINLAIHVAADREAAVANVVSSYRSDIKYESVSLEKYEGVYDEVFELIDTATESEFYAALDELTRAIADLQLLNPLLRDGSLDFTKSSIQTSLQTGFDAYLVDDNSVTFTGDLWTKYFTMDFGLNYKVAPTSFALQPRNIWPERMAGAIIYGSNDGDSWVQLTEEAEYSDQLQRLDVKEEFLGEAYRYFKVSTTDTSNYYGRKNTILSVGEFRIHGERLEIPSRLAAISIGTNAATLTQHMQGSGSANNIQVPVKKAIAGDTLTLHVSAKQPLTELTATIAGLAAEVTKLNDLNYSASVTLNDEAAHWNAGKNAVFEINYKYEDARNNNIETTGQPVEGTTDGSTVLVSDIANRIDDILGKATLTFNRSTDIGAEIGPRLFDQNTNTFVDIRNESGAGSNIYYQFDFGDGGVSLSSVELAPRMTSNLATRMVGTYVAGSNDGVTYKKLSSESKLVWDWQGLTVTDSTYYRYIRLINHSSWFGNMSEVEFFGSYVEDRSTIVEPPVIDAITISEDSTHKTQYEVGEPLSVVGLALNIGWSDATTSQLEVTEEMVSGFDSSEPAAIQTLTITYEGRTTTYTITIVAAPAPTIESIAVGSTGHKTQYQVGEALDVTALTLNVGWSDQTTSVVPVSVEMISGFDSSVPAESQTITITYEGRTTTYTITVADASAPTIESIAIGSTEHRTQYQVGESLDVTGLTLNVIWSDATKTDAPVTSEMVSGFDSSEPAASQTLTIAYEGRSTTYTITISSAPVPTIESIAVGSTGHKTHYLVGDTLDVTGLTLNVNWSDQTTTEVAVTSDMVSGFHSGSAVSNQMLTITYQGLTATYRVSIASRPVIVNPPATHVISFDSSGGTPVSSVTVNSGSTVSALPITEREGYIFEGWYNADGTPFSAGVAIYSSRTIKAKWSEKPVVPEPEEPQEPEQPVKPEPVFTDVPETNWASKEIGRLVELGAISGYEDGSFRPNATVTRAEFLKMLVLSLGLEAEGGKTFADTQGHWAEEYVSIAEALGIISGRSDNIFAPDATITREEMAVILARVSKITSTLTTTFKDDFKVSVWAEEAIAALAEAGIMGGYPDGSFKPQNHATRAQAAAVIVRMLDYLLEN